LPSGDADLAGIHHDDVIAHVHVGAVVRFVLALEPMGDLSGEATEGFAFRINDIPIAADAARLGEHGPGRHGVWRLVHRDHKGGRKKAGKFTQAGPSMQSRLLRGRAYNGVDGVSTFSRPPHRGGRSGTASGIRSSSRFATYSRRTPPGAAEARRN